MTLRDAHNRSIQYSHLPKQKRKGLFPHSGGHNLFQLGAEFATLGIYISLFSVSNYFGCNVSRCNRIAPIICGLFPADLIITLFSKCTDETI